MMGTTIVAAKFTGNEFRIAWVGDSRAYLVNNEIELLTCDHSVAQELKDRGLLQSGDINEFPSKHILTRCVGATTNPQVEIEIAGGCDNVTALVVTLGD